MDTIYKVLENCEVKKVGERQYEFTASTADMDRDGEVIDVSGWDLKNFKKNPVIMFGHDYKTLPIGRATKIGVRDGKLINTVEFPPEGTYEFADTVARLVDAGYLKTQSVGFIPKKWEDDDFLDDGKGQKPRRTYTKQELLEISIVPVPSNPNALMNAVKEGIITTKQFEAITKPEETDNMYRIPVPGEAGKHTDHKIRTIDIDKNKGIKALYCMDDKKNITYMFDKDKWDSMEAARAWMMEHMPKSVSQSEIIDEIDYLKSLITNGLNDDARKSFNELIKSTWGELIKMDMGKMQEMHDMMASAETMAKKSKKMAEDMMAENDIEDKKRISGSDIPVKDKEGILTNQDILESLKRISNIGG